MAAPSPRITAAITSTRSSSLTGGQDRPGDRCGEGGCPVYVRKGTLIDRPSDSAMESAHGGSSNLEDLSARLGRGETLDKAWLAN